MTNIVEIFKNKIEAAGHCFFFGGRASLEYELQQMSLTQGQIGVMINITDYSDNTQTNTYNGEVVYSLQMLMFRKFEVNSMANADELMKQKWDNRLFEIMNESYRLRAELFNCGDMDILSSNNQLLKNTTSQVVDGVLTTLRIKLTNQYVSD